MEHSGNSHSTLHSAWHEDILSAAMLLTRIPVSFPADRVPNTARSYWAFPLIGIVVSIVPIIIASLLMSWGLPVMASAGLILLGIMLLSGGLHQDGLADLADSLGGRDPEHRLKIMRESAIGSYGTLALIMVIAINIACLTSLGQISTTAMMGGMMTVAALSRSMMGVQRYMHQTPDQKGLANMTGAPSQPILLIGVGIALFIGFVFASPFETLVMAAIGLITTFLLGKFMKSWLGGVNGDGLGATQQISEMTMLMTLIILAA